MILLFQFCSFSCLGDTYVLLKTKSIDNGDGPMGWGGEPRLTSASIDSIGLPHLIPIFFLFCHDPWSKFPLSRTQTIKGSPQVRLSCQHHHLKAGFDKATYSS